VQDEPNRGDGREQQHVERAGLLLTGDHPGSAPDREDDEQDGQHRAEQLGVHEARAGPEVLEVEQFAHGLGVAGEELLQVWHVPDGRPQRRLQQDEENDADTPADQRAALVA
jgi:hypothetical protein